MLRWRSSRAEKLRLQQELEEAHQMQVRLLPESAPEVEGFDIAGFSRPAREVGGDFFDYLSMGDGRIGIALVDISGKGLRGAMNAVMANSVLNEVAKGKSSCGEILSVLNAALYPRMDKNMFTALGFAILHQDSRIMKWSSAGQPYPLIKRDKQVF
jgi:sigma-B regulation protein RsbU (phosphoserine phosphatase)